MKTIAITALIASTALSFTYPAQARQGTWNPSDAPQDSNTLTPADGHLLSFYPPADCAKDDSCAPDSTESGSSR